MSVEIQHTFRYLSENILKNKEETPPLKPTYSAKTFRVFLNRSQRKAAQVVKGIQIESQRDMSTEGVRRLNTVMSKILKMIHILQTLGEKFKLDWRCLNEQW